MQRFGTALIPEVNMAFIRSVAIAAQGLVEDLNPTDTDGRRWVERFHKPLTTPESADTSKNTEIVPTSRGTLAQDLLNYQFNERASGKTVEVINREFFNRNKKRLGKSEVEREKAFATVKRTARRCKQRT